MVTINERRLLDRIGKLGQIGKDLDGKRTRLAADDAEKSTGLTVSAGILATVRQRFLLCL